MAGNTSIEIPLQDTSSRQIEGWPTANQTITGTIQWEGQAAKPVTGVITFRETIDSCHFYDWAYSAADRPLSASSGILVLTDGTYTTPPIGMRFVRVATLVSQLSAFLIKLRIEDRDGNIVPFCEVVITTTNASDSEAVHRKGSTNDAGDVEFDLSDGTYYVWRNKVNFEFTDPVTLTVNADGTHSVS